MLGYFAKSVACFVQEVLVWLTKCHEQLQDDISDEELRDFIWETLNSGQVCSQFVVIIYVHHV